jgi:hypothetical protein
MEAFSKVLNLFVAFLVGVGDFVIACVFFPFKMGHATAKKAVQLAPRRKKT